MRYSLTRIRMFFAKYTRLCIFQATQNTQIRIHDIYTSLTNQKLSDTQPSWQDTASRYRRAKRFSAHYIIVRFQIGYTRYPSKACNFPSRPCLVAAVAARSLTGKSHSERSDTRDARQYVFCSQTEPRRLLQNVTSPTRIRIRRQKCARDAQYTRDQAHRCPGAQGEAAAAAALIYNFATAFGRS